MWRKKDMTREYHKGEIIFKEGDIGRDMFIIYSGSVDIIKKHDGEDVVLATLKRGEFFGEMALLENVPRTATVITQEATSVLALNISSFMMQIRKDPAFAYNIMQKLSHRLQITTAKLMGLIDKIEGSPSEIKLDIARSVHTRKLLSKR